MFSINVSGNSATLLGGIFVERQPVLLLYTTRYLKEARAIGGSLAINDSISKSVAILGTDRADKYVSLSNFYAVGKYDTRYMRDTYNHDTVVVGQSISERVGRDILITSKDDMKFNIFNVLLKNTTIPIQLEWIDYITQEMLALGLMSDIDADIIPIKKGFVEGLAGTYEFRNHKNARITSNDTLKIPYINSRGVKELPYFEELLCYSFKFTEEELMEIVSKGIKSGVLWAESNQSVSLIGDPTEEKYLEYDEYIQRFSAELSKALDKAVVPLNRTNTDLKGTALKGSRLYKPQRGCVNAIARAKEAGRKFVIATEEMGCGKTKQGISAVEEYFNSKWLKAHPDKTLKDCFESKEVSYRTIITGPGHIMEKWGAEIRKEIPDAKVYTVKSVDDFAEIKRKGKARDGKEFYVISKDSLKLGSFYSPIPQDYGKRTPKIRVCRTCKDDNNVYEEKPVAGNCRCPKCKENDWVSVPFRNASHYKDGRQEYVKVSGMICPCCGDLLLKKGKVTKNYNASLSDIEEAVLRPEDFAGKTSDNQVCYNCGAPLWGVDAKNIGNSERKTLWRKVKHFVNMQKKGTKTAFVYAKKALKKETKEEYYPYVESYLQKVKAPTEFSFLPNEAGVRRVAPAEYIKKYLKGYFDVCILDECHKFEGAGSAQSIAAGALVKASDFTIGLTGTIANGKADSFFWLLWMLMPRRMKEKGYNYDAVSLMRFVKKYGSTVTRFKAEELERGYNKASRGKQIGTPKIAPGISPLLFVDFLLENCVFLDMGDMSSALPELNETIVNVEMPDDILESYSHDIRAFVDAIRSGCGMTIASTMQMYALSYPDYPFKREKVMSPIQENVTLVEPADYSEEYSDVLLPKEERMVEIVNSELKEGRRCFIFASFTGEHSPLKRWQSIIEDKCNLLGRVAVLESKTVSADKREQWIHEKAAQGAMVVLCNCKLVETGLDFCFYHEDRFYNYPTILFMQTTYDLAVLWQASHRHYRLNQPEECRTYWLAYEHTLQMTALQLMAEKIVAVSAIQGKFSSGALTAMAKGVDARLKLAESLKKGSETSVEEVNELFKKAGGGVDRIDVDENPMNTYWEVMGINPENEELLEDSEQLDLMDFVVTTEIATEEVVNVPTETVEKPAQKKRRGKNTVDIEDFEFNFFDFFEEDKALLKNAFDNASKSKKKKARPVEGQLTLLDLFA